MQPLSRSSNKNISGKINVNQAIDWGELYNNYSACMLGIIFSLLKNKKQSEELLQKVFIKLIRERELANQKCNLCVQLYVYTLEFTINYSQKRCIDISENVRQLPDFLQLLVAKNKNRDHAVVDNENKLTYDLLPASNFDILPRLVAAEF